jgi:putative ABC transport system permease protein
MLKNYITIALRNISRNKAYSAINIFGLSLGVACCLLLAFYIQDEFSVDKHLADSENIYRIVTHFDGEMVIDESGTASPPIAMTANDEIPEVVSATRLVSPPGVGENLIKYEDNIFYETEGFVADSTLFDVLTYTLTEGNPKKALVDANSVVISETMAKKLFGNSAALNKVISISQGGPAADFRVTGVFKDNHKSHVMPHFFTSMTSTGWAEYLRSNGALDEWAGQNFVPSYLKLAPGHRLKDVEKKLNDMLVRHGAEDMKALGIPKTLSLELVKDIYLYSDVHQSPRIVYIYIIASIAVFILLIACINFMNLSTAKATKRAGEIGLRKAMGAVRSSLIGQILGEAMIIVIISILISLVMVQLSLPLFNSLTGKDISFNSGNAAYVIGALATLTVVTGLLAGSYPAFYLSSFQPAQVLKGKAVVRGGSGLLRQSLVVFQFMIAIALVCGMLIIGSQLRYIENKNLGFNSEALIVLPMRSGNALKNAKALQLELQRVAHVKKVSSSAYVPGSQVWSDFSLYAQGGNMDNAVDHLNIHVGPGYTEILDLKILAGRTFSEDTAQEKEGNLVINRTGAKSLGFEPEKAVGQDLFTEWQGVKYTFHIIGVMEDYHQSTLKEKIRPTLFQLFETASPDYVLLKADSRYFKETIADVEKVWKSMIDDTPFEYTFLDENIRKNYAQDRKVSAIITTFTLLAMLISCLGLYGLSTFMAERRFKEIGVRKVLGADVRQIVALMSKEFVKLVLIAFVIAVPLAWYAMSRWLEGFEYKTTIDVLIFVYSGLAALAIALTTVSFESIRAAIANPVNALRNE